jgi:hypothetical protein
MNAKEKAYSLVQKFANHSMGGTRDSNLNSAKNCALICVKEIIESLRITTGHCELRRLDLHEVNNDFAFWDKVVTEIEALK